MHPQDFPPVFERLTGSSPFPWQSALYKRFIDADFTSSATLPTGLGKTSIIAIWLIALAQHPDRVPRRLAYVVNRRTVVDQTSTEVEKWRTNLEAAGIRSALASLCAVPLSAEDDQPLAISTLRGQFADNRAWSADPARPAVIVGTVDMIGSRLLFSGYGSGFKTRPHHAGFLGQDTLIVHDEAHLEPAFQDLLETLARRQTTDRDLRPLRVLALSATNRTNDQAAHALTPADHDHPIVRQRIHAAKKPTLHPIADEKKELADKLTALALARRDSGRAVLIFARHLDVVQRVTAALEKAKLQPAPVKLVGPLRGYERDRLVYHPTFQRFLPPSGRAKITEAIPTGTVFLIATSAGEVGVNLSADDLICDLSTFESMAQRLGRVNRFGDLPDSAIDLVHPTSFDEKDPFTPARENTLALFRKLAATGAASPAALGDLPAADRLAAFSTPPAILPATDILFDAWSLTTIRGSLPGRPPVADYLHGVADWEPSETQVAWRTEVELLNTPALRELYPPSVLAELLADYPLLPHELLRDRAVRVLEQLKKLAQRPDLAARPDFPVWIVGEDGEIEPTTLAALAKIEAKNADARLGDRTVLLPPAAGGLNADGSLDGSAPPTTDGSEDISAESPNRDAKARRTRIRSDAPVRNLTLPDPGFRFIRPRLDLDPEAEEIDAPDPTDTESTPAQAGRYWYWLESPHQIGGANLHQSRESVRLGTHLADVERIATAIADKLQLPPELRRPLILAARHHDAGKARLAWQKGIGNPTPSEPLAKAGRDLHPRETGDSYRHEFGSLLDVATDPEFLALAEVEKDIVLHLIAAHHGRARPHFPADEARDPVAPFAAVQSECAAVPLRFARLQRRFGRWGLAYLESLLRAADYAASANPSETVEAIK
jgi:CRISPR-associated endonuclease/helicase Cas3